MLETIIKKMAHYFGDSSGWDYEDMQHILRLKPCEIQCIKEIVEDEHVSIED